MFIFTPNFDVGVGVFGLNWLYFLLEFFFPSFLLVLFSLTVRRSRNPQSHPHLFEILPPLLPTNGLAN
jgi:hypothetical protein